MSMNEDERILEELSAHVDGLAQDPIALDEAMQRNPELTRRYDQMLALSRRLQAMPAPDVHPAFVTRVMARVAETRQDRRVPLWRWAAIGCAAALIAGVVGIRPWNAATTPLPAKVTVNTAQNTASPDVFDSAIQNMADAGDIPGIDAPAVDDTSQPDPAEQAAVFASVENAVEADLDLDTVLMSLTSEEVSQLQQMLQRHDSDKGSWS